MATTNKKRRKARGGKKMFEEDRLSALPQDLIFRILSFMDFVDVLNTSLISKRWRNVWRFAPFVNFDSGVFYERVDVGMPDCKFWVFVVRALHKRVECPVTRLTLSTDETCVLRLNTLLRMAPFTNFKELCLLNGDYVGNYMDIPEEVCQVITTLTIDFHNNVPLEVEAPFIKLKRLYLRGVGITLDVAQKIFSVESVCLENVHIEGCQFVDVETFTISAKNIRNLTILNMYCFGNTWVVGPFHFSLHVSSSNLVSFSYIGPMLTNIALSNTWSLQDALFRIIPVPPNRKYGMGINNENRPPRPARFQGLNNAKVLTISSLVVKYMSPALTFYTESFILDRLNCLKLGLRYNVDCIEGLINILKHAPNLESLVIRCREISPDSWQERKAKEGPVLWKSRIEDIACLSYHLKNIDISGFDGSEIAIQLVKFLLRNAKVLEKAEIYMSRSKNHRQKLFNSLGNKFSRSSPKAVISFSRFGQRGFPWFQNGDSDPEDN